MTVFSQISWQGGICNDEYLADSTQFSDCEDINIYESSGYIKLGPNKTTSTITGAAGYYNTFTFKSSSGDYTYLVGKTGTLNNGVFADATNPSSYIETSGKGILLNGGVATVDSGTDTTVGVGYVITNKGGFYKWSFDSDTAYGGFTDGGLTNVIPNETSECYYAPCVVRGPLIYYSYFNIIRCIDSSVSMTEVPVAGGTSGPILTIDSGYTITNLVVSGTRILIYANNGKNTKKIFWDGLTEDTSEFIFYKSKKIHNIAQFGNYDIALYSTENQYSIGYIEGYDMKPILSSDLPADINKRGFQTFSSDSVGSVVTGDNFLSFNNDINAGTSNAMYCFGNFKPGKPLALSKISTNLDGTINLITGDGYLNTLYSWYSSSVAQKLVLGTGYDSTGYVITNPIKGRAVSLKKSAKKVMYGYELQTGSTIKVYYQFDKNDTEQSSLNWTLLDTITVGTDFPDGMGYRVINIDGKFNIARFKIQLETSNSSYSPKLFDFHFEYDETNAEL